jgi:hypothetical protein
VKPHSWSTIARLGVRVLVVMPAAVLFLLPLTARAQVVGGLEFAEGTAIVAEFGGGSSTASATVTLVNRGAATAVAFSAILEDEDGQDVSGSVSIAPNPGVLDARSVTRVVLTITSSSPGTEAFGQVVVTPTIGGLPAIAPMEVGPPVSRSFQPELIAFAAGVIALAFVWIRAIFLGWGTDETFSLSDKMGQPGWSFSESWASTLTVALAVVGTVAASSVLPPEPLRMSTIGYIGLSLFFGGLTVFAPIVYVAFRSHHPVTDPDEHSSTHGYVGGFLAAAAVTLWAAFGQLFTLGVAADEIAVRYSLKSFARWGMVGAVVIAGFLVVRYAWTSIPWTISDQKVDVVEMVDGVQETRTEGSPRPWSLL